MFGTTHIPFRDADDIYVSNAVFTGLDDEAQALAIGVRDGRIVWVAPAGAWGVEPYPVSLTAISNDLGEAFIMPGFHETQTPVLPRVLQAAGLLEPSSNEAETLAAAARIAADLSVDELADAYRIYIKELNARGVTTVCDVAPAESAPVSEFEWVRPDAFRQLELSNDLTVRARLFPPLKEGDERLVELQTQLCGPAIRAFGCDNRNLPPSTLQPGVFADLVILAGNPLTCDPAQVSSIPVIATIMGGRIVYQRS